MFKKLIVAVAALAIAGPAFAKVKGTVEIGQAAKSAKRPGNSQVSSLIPFVAQVESALLATVGEMSSKRAGIENAVATIKANNRLARAVSNNPSLLEPLVYALLQLEKIQQKMVSAEDTRYGQMDEVVEYIAKTLVVMSQFHSVQIADNDGVAATVHNKGTANQYAVKALTLLDGEDYLAKAVEVAKQKGQEITEDDVSANIQAVFHFVNGGQGLLSLFNENNSATLLNNEGQLNESEGFMNEIINDIVKANTSASQDENAENSIVALNQGFLDYYKGQQESARSSLGACGAVKTGSSGVN